MLEDFEICPENKESPDKELDVVVPETENITALPEMENIVAPPAEPRPEHVIDIKAPKKHHDRLKAVLYRKLKPKKEDKCNDIIVAKNKNKVKEPIFVPEETLSDDYKKLQE